MGISSFLETISLCVESRYFFWLVFLLRKVIIVCWAQWAPVWLLEYPQCQPFYSVGVVTFSPLIFCWFRASWPLSIESKPPNVYFHWYLVLLFLSFWRPKRPGIKPVSGFLRGQKLLLQAIVFPEYTALQHSAIVLILYCYITISPQTSQLKTTHIYYLTVSVSVGIQARSKWVLCKTVIKVSARAGFSSGFNWERFCFHACLFVGSIQFLIGCQCRLSNQGPQFLAGFWLKSPSASCCVVFSIWQLNNMREQVASPKLVSKGVSSQDKHYSLIYCDHMHTIWYILPPLLYSVWLKASYSFCPYSGEGNHTWTWTPCIGSWEPP